jgi:hypothetical protein
MQRIRLMTLIVPLILMLVPVQAEAGLLFHATKRSLAKRIFTKGFAPAKMSKQARFGKGAYLSRSPRTALKEKPGADAVVVFKDTKSLNKRTLQVNRMTKPELKAFSGDRDLRGNVRHKIIGPSLGRKIGSSANKAGRSVTYSSVKDKKGKNVVIPSRVYRENPHLIKPVRIDAYGK